jgi:hypothetical protein
MRMPGIIPPGPDGVGRAADAGRVIAGGGDTRWAGISHEEIWSKVQQGDPVAASENASLAWMKTQVLIQSIEERLSAVVSGTAADWEGAAATAARGAVSTLGQWAIDGAAGAQNIGRTLLDQSHEALYVRQQMPEPRTQALSAEWDKFWNDPGYVVENALDGFSDLRSLEEQADNDAQRARELMAQYEARSLGEHIPRMQDMTPPPQVTVGIGPAAAPPGPPGAPGPGFGAPVPAAPGGDVPVGPAGTPGVPPPPAGPAPSVSPVPTPPGGPGATPTAVPTPPAAQVPPPEPGTGIPSTPAATPPAAQATPVPGTAGPANPAAVPPAQRQDRTAIPPPPGLPSTPSVPRPGGAGPGGAPPGGLPPVVPRPAPTAAQPSWRDVVQSNARAGDNPQRPPAPGVRAVPEAPVRAAPFGERTGAGGTEPASRSAAPRPGGSSYPGMYPPIAGTGAGGESREHRRAPFLIDDTDAFADDRWFPPPVITPDN